MTSCLCNYHIYDIYHVCIKLAQFAKLHFWQMVALETVVKVIMLLCITKAKQLWFLFLIYLYMFFTFLETGFNSQVKLTYWWTLCLSVNPFLENFALAMGWIRLQFLRHCISFQGTCLFTSSKENFVTYIHTYIYIYIYLRCVV